MRDIESLIGQYHCRITQKYYNKSPIEVDKEDHKKYLWSLYLAEMYAFLKDVIPEQYIPYSIFDYTGQLSVRDDKGNIVTEQVVPVETSIQIKDKICRYCYNSTWDDIKQIGEGDKEKAQKYMRQNNCMNIRLNNAENVVIHGERSVKAGRTMLASLIMKEAIRGRILHQGMRYNSYRWVNFWSLVSDLKKESDEEMEFRTCDWLVVDDITNTIKTPQQKTFLCGILDPFFYDRHICKLPTILIFKFDINGDGEDIEGCFGSGMVKIIESPRTIIIKV